jgi:hypothetical protein
MTNIKITISGDEEVAKALQEFPQELETAAELAGQEAAAEILGTEGIQKYPPATAANAPPTPYYKRGVGMQYKTRNDNRSEQYGKRWSTESEGYKTVSSNIASYAKFLVSDLRQAAHMARIGWRMLGDVAREKRDILIGIYEGWVERALEKLGLK